MYAFERYWKFLIRYHAKTPKEVTAQKITKTIINYRSGIAFKEMLIDLKFNKV